MGRNVEIKARVDDLGALEARVRGIADAGPETIAELKDVVGAKIIGLARVGA